MIMKVSTFLGDESRWCQGAFALDKANNHVFPETPEAVRWCVHGAMEVCAYTGQEKLQLVQAVRALCHESTTAWQDTPERTFAEVHELLLRMGH